KLRGVGRHRLDRSRPEAGTRAGGNIDPYAPGVFRVLRADDHANRNTIDHEELPGFSPIAQHTPDALDSERFGSPSGHSPIALLQIKFELVLNLKTAKSARLGGAGQAPRAR